MDLAPMDPAHTERTVASVGLRVILSDPAVRVVTLVVFVIMLGFGVVAPILPLYARSFGVGYDAAGLLISSFAFTRLVFDLVAGPIVDRWGERRSASAGIFFVALSSVLTGLAPTFTLAVVARGAGGAGSAVLFAALYSYLLKVVPKDRMARSLGVFYFAFNVGVIAGAPLGGLVARLGGLAAPLFAYAGILVVSGLLYLRFVHDPAPRAGVEPPLSPEEALAERQIPVRRRTRSKVAALLRQRAFVTVIVVNMAYLWFVAAVYNTLLPLFGRDGLGMSTVGISVVFAVALLAELLVLYPAGSWADRMGRKPVMVPALAGLAAVMALTGFAPNALVYALLMVPLGLVSGVAGVPPAAMLSDVAPEEGSGTAVGVFRFCGDLGFVFGPILAGVATSGLGFKGAFAVSSLPVVLALALVVATPETMRRPQPPG